MGFDALFFLMEDGAQAEVAFAAERSESAATKQHPKGEREGRRQRVKF